ncbi:putative saccharopine dehydrogenase; Rossman-fold NADP-binding domain [Pseudorhizobium banfieldiae]|uniref:Putative saccharopine dehydrogenase Rossman-fold NADP-binding domain n=1 Tax=Pseudorhizobium banfieldiae TaxID=1125847 RepID=L0NA61_9HYPH|nr:saccharopine dehydrogenase C-terminal domain-containing protein [Pseudorhizobium banfieldiae]CAD6598304.1 pyridine nucleotide-disulfide oxidoreductase [arsenite-oxidising bacterium NT-25]CCF17878.1 putative saccharopine dehydrogenase; Rossman-fold NADP-binding domain [Pseudorhizobium banfieldiae]
MAKLNVCIFGAGEIGTALASTLSRNDGFAVKVVDPSEDALDRIRKRNLDVKLQLVSGADGACAALSNQDIAVAAVPEAAVKDVALAALAADVHYLDFTCPTDAVRATLARLAEQRAVFSGCGVSPGLVGNIACSLLSAFSPITDLTIRVGANPIVPTNRLGYGQIWNLDGLISEYTKPSAAIRDGQFTWIESLEGLERLTIDGVTYEGFTTAGGLGDLSIFGEKLPRNVTFKTIRYPGHLDYMRFLLDDLGLRHRRDMLRSLLANGLPVIEDDTLLLVLTARGLRGRQPIEKTVHHRFSASSTFGAFNALTSVAVGYAATLMSLLLNDRVPSTGLIAHHRLDTSALISSPYLGPLMRT